MEVLEVQRMVERVVGLATHSENQNIYLLYDNLKDADDAFQGMYELFGLNELELHFNFTLNYDFIPLNGNTLKDPDGLVTISIHDLTTNEFLILRDVKVAGNITTYTGLHSISLRNNSNLEIDQNYKSVTLATGLKQGEDVQVPYALRLHMPGLSNIKNITVLPERKNIISIPVPRPTVGPDGEISRS